MQHTRSQDQGKILELQSMEMKTRKLEKDYHHKAVALIFRQSTPTPHHKKLIANRIAQQVGLKSTS